MLQQDCRSDAIADMVERVLVDPAIRDLQVEGGRLVAAELGAGARAPSLRAADAVLKTIRETKRR